MSLHEWTDEELSEFINLVNMAGSHSQMDRITSRCEMPEFIKKHGQGKCDMMYSHMEDNNL